MKMKLKFVLVLLVAIAMCGSSAFGANYWDGLTDSNWSGDNWTDYGATPVRAVPVPGDYVICQNGDIVLDVAGFAGDMQVGPSLTGSLDIQSSLDVTGSFWAGMYADGDGTINLNGAHDVNATYTSIGFASGANGVLNISDGTWTASGNFIVGAHEDCVGTINMTGGTITTPYFGLGNGVDSIANVNISDGTITQTLPGNFNIDPNSTVTFSEGTGKIVYADAATYEVYLSSLIGINFINAQANVVGDTVEITYLASGVELPLQIESFDDWVASGWTEGVDPNVVYQNAPVAGAVEGVSCMEVAFDETIAWDLVPLKAFVSPLDMTPVEERSVSLWVYSDEIALEKVSQIILLDTSGAIARYNVGQLGVGWQQVIAPVSGFAIDGGGAFDFAAVNMIQIWCSTWDTRGGSIFIDDLVLDEYEEIFIELPRHSCR